MVTTFQKSDKTFIAVKCVFPVNRESIPKLMSSILVADYIIINVIVHRGTYFTVSHDAVFLVVYVSVRPASFLLVFIFGTEHAALFGFVIAVSIAIVRSLVR